MAAHRFRLLPRLALGGLLVVAAHLHFPEDSLALHLLLERAEGLIDIVVTNEHLHFWPDSFPEFRQKTATGGLEATRMEALGSTNNLTCEVVPLRFLTGSLFLTP